jgi:NADH-quinone oxidoreductase subunit C
VAVPEESKDPNPVLPESNAPDGATQSAPAVTPAADAVAKPTQNSETKEAAPAAEKPAAPAAAAKPAAAAAAKPAAPPKPEGPKPLPWESELVTKLREHYGAGIKEASTYLGQKYLVVDSAIVYEILLRMFDEEQFDYLVDVTAVHYPKREAQFDVVYILYSFPQNERVRVKTQINDGEKVQSATGIWPTTNWLEREVFDMFGIEFEGHPELKRILLPDEWKGHPLRKEYPILQQDTEWVKANLGIESGQ